MRIHLLVHMVDVLLVVPGHGIHFGRLNRFPLMRVKVLQYVERHILPLPERGGGLRFVKPKQLEDVCFDELQIRLPDFLVNVVPASDARRQHCPIQKQLLVLSTAGTVGAATPQLLLFAGFLGLDLLNVPFNEIVDTGRELKHFIHLIVLDRTFGAGGV